MLLLNQVHSFNTLQCVSRCNSSGSARSHDTDRTAWFQGCISLDTQQAQPTEQTHKQVKSLADSRGLRDWFARTHEWMICQWTLKQLLVCVSLSYCLGTRCRWPRWPRWPVLLVRPPWTPPWGVQCSAGPIISIQSKRNIADSSCCRSSFPSDRRPCPPCRGESQRPGSPTQTMWVWCSVLTVLFPQ